MPKNNPRTHSPQQNKKAVLTTAAYCKVCTPARSQRQQSCFVYLRLPKRVFLVSNRKSEHHHWILHIRISVGTKFQLKLTSLIFWTKFLPKGYFQSKTNKMNTTIEFCIFELVLVPNFRLNWQFWFLGPKLPKSKRGNSSQKGNGFM